MQYELYCVFFPVSHKHLWYFTMFCDSVLLSYCPNADGLNVIFLFAKHFRINLLSSAWHVDIHMFASLPYVVVLAFSLSCCVIMVPYSGPGAHMWFHSEGSSSSTPTPESNAWSIVHQPQLCSTLGLSVIFLQSKFTSERAGLEEVRRIWKKCTYLYYTSEISERFSVENDTDDENIRLGIENGLNWQKLPHSEEYGVKKKKKEKRAPWETSSSIHYIAKWGPKRSTCCRLRKWLFLAKAISRRILLRQMEEKGAWGCLSWSTSFVPAGLCCFLQCLGLAFCLS